MKTREQLYGEEAPEVLDCITSYHCITREQLRRLFPKKSVQLDSLLTYLLRQGRIYYDPDGADIFFDKPETGVDQDMLSAICVLCDFAERTEFHSVAEAPAKLLFFADGELYDVVVVPRGKETLINCMLSERNEGGKRFVVIEDTVQSEVINIPNTVAFCKVDWHSGTVEYYTSED